MSYVIKKPVVTEKNSSLGEKGIYVFEVNRKANKTVIKDHVERYFKVKVRSVKTAIGRREGRRLQGNRSQTVNYYKKAFVRLKEGERIQIFEGN